MRPCEQRANAAVLSRRSRGSAATRAISGGGPLLLLIVSARSSIIRHGGPPPGMRSPPVRPSSAQEHSDASSGPFESLGLGRSQRSCLRGWAGGRETRRSAPRKLASGAVGSPLCCTLGVAARQSSRLRRRGPCLTLGSPPRGSTVRRNCVYGCRCPDSVTHYVKCEVLWGAIGTAAGIAPGPTVRHRLGFEPGSQIAHRPQTKPAGCNAVMLALAVDIYHKGRSDPDPSGLLLRRARDALRRLAA